MSKKSKQSNGQKPAVDVQHLERLVDTLLTADYSLPFYEPDAVARLPWKEIQEGFWGGYNFALARVLRALQGDGGQALQEILDREVIVVRPDDQPEYQEKISRGATVVRLV